MVHSSCHTKSAVWRSSGRLLFLSLTVGIALSGTAQTSNAAVIAHWSFDEINASNQFEDDSGNAYHATIQATGIEVGAATLTVDTSDKIFGAGAANFNRGSAHVTDQNNGDAEDGMPGSYATVGGSVHGIYDDSHTVAAWVKVSQETSWSGLVGDWSNDSGSARAYLYGFTGDTAGDNAEKPMLTVQGENGGNGPINFSATGTGPFTKDEWHHVAWVVHQVSETQSNLEIWVDGALYNSATWNNASGTDIRETTHPTWIGLKEDNGIDLHAKVDELWIFDTNLSPGSIRSLMNTNAIPEPASVTLLGVGMLLFYTLRRRSGN